MAGVMQSGHPAILTVKEYKLLKRNAGIVLCITGIALFGTGIGTGFCGESMAAMKEAGSDSLSELSEQSAPGLTKQVRPKPPEETTLYPERVIFPEPIAVLDGERGKLSYRWGDDCVLVDENTALLSCDCYFESKEIQQKIFYLAEAPDYVPREVFRQDSRRGSAGGEVVPESKFPDVLERRLICPRPVQAFPGAEYGFPEMDKGYVYELDGALYCLSADFQETVFICDIRELMGELYAFSPWTSEDAVCDVSGDASRMLACTDEGLYEYDLKQGGKILLEPAVFLPAEMVPVEGDCDCGETGFEFTGPVAVEYTPDDRGCVFLVGNEYGDRKGIVLRSGNGDTLYQKTPECYEGGFQWMKSEDAVYLAVFYQENGAVWMDQVDIHTGETETFAVPEEVLCEGNFCAGFLPAGSEREDALSQAQNHVQRHGGCREGQISRPAAGHLTDEDILLFCSEYVSEFWEKNGRGKSQYQIFRLRSGEIQEWKTISPEETAWRLILLRQGGYESVVVRYPQVFSDVGIHTGDYAGAMKNQQNPK